MSTIDALNRKNGIFARGVDPANFPVSQWIHNPDLSGVIGIDRMYWVIDGETVTHMPLEEIAAAEVIRLPKAKVRRMQAIDDKTAFLIWGGFEFPSGSGKVFSLSVESQANIHGVFTARNLPAMVYPVHWLTKDDGDFYDLQDATDVENFFLAAIGTIRSIKDAGSALKALVQAATTTAEVNAIADTR